MQHKNYTLMDLKLCEAGIKRIKNHIAGIESTTMEDILKNVSTAMLRSRLLELIVFRSKLLLNQKPQKIEILDYKRGVTYACNTSLSAKILLKIHDHCSIVKRVS
jgi:hypothetical protein